MKVKIVPKTKDGLVAIRWHLDGKNWREVLTAMRCELREQDGAPAVLTDYEGEDFSPGDWFVCGTGKSYTDAEFHENYEMVAIVIEDSDAVRAAFVPGPNEEKA